MAQCKLVKIMLALCLSQSWLTAAWAENAAVQAESGSWSKQERQILRSGTKTEIRGNVLSTSDSPLTFGDDTGVFLKLRTEQGDVSVEVGPRWFMSKHDFNLTRGEPLTVVGIKISVEKAPRVLASEIRRGEQKMVLRESSGQPKWLKEDPKKP